MEILVYVIAGILTGIVIVFFSSRIKRWIKELPTQDSGDDNDLY